MNQNSILNFQILVFIFHKLPTELLIEMLEICGMIKETKHTARL